MAKWSINLEREDGKAGDEDIRVTAVNEDEAVAKAKAVSDPSFTKVVAATKL